MDNKRRGLHRGLDSLLSDNAKRALSDEVQVAIAPQPQAGEQVRTLGVELLHRGQYQPRRDFDQAALQELAESIKTQGIIQPILVRRVAHENYEIIAGERRWRAAQLAGLAEVPVIIRDISDRSAMAVSLIENIQREDLNPLEESMALHRLLEEFNLTHDQIAETVGKSRVTVTNLLRLIKLTPEVKTFLQQGDLQMGHARALLSLEGQSQISAAKIIVAKELSVREAEILVRRLLSNTPVVQKPAVDPNVKRLEMKLSEKLGAKITIQSNPKGKGKIEINFNSLDELDGILEHII